MSGWEKVIAATLVALVGLIALNVAIWRRMSVALSDQTQPGSVATLSSVEQAGDKEQ